MNRNDWIDVLFKALKLIIGNAWNRTGAALSLIGAGALVGWIDKLAMALFNLKWDEPAQWIGWVILFVGIAMLAYGARKARTPNPHDVDLIAKFRQLFRTSDMDFLQSHNFANNWHMSRTECFEEIADSWIDAKHEFVDRKLNKLFNEVKRLSAELASAESMGFSIGPKLESRTMRTGADTNGLSAVTRKKVDNLNRLARELGRAVNALEKSAKMRLA